MKAADIRSPKDLLDTQPIFTITQVHDLITAACDAVRAVTVFEYQLGCPEVARLNDKIAELGSVLDHVATNMTVDTKTGEIDYTLVLKKEKRR